MGRENFLTDFVLLMQNYYPRSHFVETAFNCCPFRSEVKKTENPLICPPKFNAHCTLYMGTNFFVNYSRECNIYHIWSQRKLCTSVCDPCMFAAGCICTYKNASRANVPQENRITHLSDACRGWLRLENGMAVQSHWDLLLSEDSTGQYSGEEKLYGL